MVFCCSRTVFESWREWVTSFIWNIFKRDFQPAVCGCGSFKWDVAETQKEFSVPAVSPSGGIMDHVCRKVKKQYAASFSVEAAMVLGVVLLTFGSVIRHAYRLHDTVTGAMILEETLIGARYCREETVPLDTFEERGTRLGNPRIWLGEYRISLVEQGTKVSGTAEAGDWNCEMEMKKSQPAELLRKCSVIEEIGKKVSQDGSGIQAGNESELHGDSSGAGPQG